MSIIKWSQDLSIGIDSIDEQHREMINIINELHLAVEYAAGHAVIYPLIHKLHEYASTHFEEEEQLMEQHGFPARAEHAQEHKEFIGKLDDLILRYPNSDLLTLHVRDFLLSWFFRHIRTTDMEYERFLNQQKSSLKQNTAMRKSPFKG